MTQDIGRAPDGSGSRASMEPVNGLHPPGFDPSRIADPVERAEVWQLHFFQMLEAERERRRTLEDALDVLLPMVAPFADAVSHYAGGRPQYPGSIITLPADCSTRPALTISCNGPRNGAPLSPTIGALRMLADAYAIAMEARRAATVKQGAVHDSAGAQHIAQTQPSHKEEGS